MTTTGPDDLSVTLRLSAAEAALVVAAQQRQGARLVDYIKQAALTQAASDSRAVVTPPSAPPARPASMPDQLWVYRARPEQVIDGDTIDVTLDLGRRTYATERLRLLGVNTPERKGATLAAGNAARAYVAAWLASKASRATAAWPLRVQTEKDDAFGRYLAFVWAVSTGECLNDDLLLTGQAVPYERGS